MEHRHPIRIYYEDTDVSGLVYHANYLCYFERAREHVIGPDLLVEMLRQGIGFVVYRASLDFKRGARLGDEIEIRSTYERQSDYRVLFFQSAWLGDTRLVDGQVEMVAIGPDQSPVRIPEW